MRFRILLLSLALLLPLWGQKVKLYLQDGGNLMVKEYEVVEDRVRYYSLERSQWEEIPLELVDLDRTRREVESQTARRREREQEDRIERAARRKARTELHRVPLEDGVYYSDGGKVVPVEQAELKIETSKKRVLLQVLTPVPLLSKSTVEVEGTQAKLIVGDAQPMFYVRLEKITRLAIVRLKDKKKSRLVQEIQKMRQDTELLVKQEELEVFRQQLAPQVYKLWPTEPIPPGNYAVVEHDPGGENVRVWDFTYRNDVSSATAKRAKKPSRADGSRP